MKRKLMRMALCLVLLASMLIAPMSAQAASTYKIFKLNTNANLRNPANYEDILTYMKKGTKVLWTGKKHKAFYLVSTTSGQTGYVYKEYLSEYGAVSSKQLYKTRSSSKIYKKASTGSKKVTTLSKGQHIIVYQTKGNWAYIKTLGGKGGYVKKSALKKA